MSERVRPTESAPKKPAGYNGPGKDAYLERLGKHIEIRFQIMRWMSKAAHNLAGWESSGGNKKDILDGYGLTKLSAEERQAEAARANRVWAWHGITTEEKEGQWSFASVLDAPPSEETGAGGHPLGSLPSVALARVDGYEAGKRGSLSLSDNHWAEGTQEREAWDVAFGEGVEDRPPPKPAKKAKEGEMVDTSTAKPDRASDAPTETPAPRKRGQRALPAPESDSVH